MSTYISDENLNYKTVVWLSKINPYNRELVLNNKNVALLIVDMQNFFLDENSPTYIEAGNIIKQNVKRLLDKFREKGLPVIYTCHIHHPDGMDAGIMSWWWDGMCIEGSKESNVTDYLQPLKNEKIIYKHRYSAFYNTDLETILRCLRIEDIVITGVMTNMCCESTTRDAYYRDYRVFFVADATGADTEEMHEASLLNLAYGFASIKTTDDLINALK
jgi:biuret amidohydrolase